MNKIKTIIILIGLYNFIIANNILEPILKNQVNETVKVEIGIESIIKEQDYYIIAIYAINPFDEIAGVQFKILNEDLFYIESVYGGKTAKEDFSMHFNDKGTILGFSMVGETIPSTKNASHIDKKLKNILLYAKAKANNLNEYLKDPNAKLSMDIVIASKSGKTLSSVFIPFNLANIK